MKIGLSLLFALLSLLTIKGNNYPSDSCSYTISLLSYSPASDLYSMFGHSAIRLKNNSQNTDYVYNYGTFNFNTEKFYLKFIRGKLLYSLSKVPTRYVINSVKRENRVLMENKLNISCHEAEKVYRLLEENYLPENKDYLYDFFYDNCATRIVDIVDLATRNRYTPELTMEEVTFMDLFEPYLKQQPWVIVGLQLIMGYETHKLATVRQATFLPDYLQHYLMEYKYNGASLMAGTEILYSPTNASVKGSSALSSPFFILGFILLLTLLLGALEVYVKRNYLLIDYIVLLPYIMVGILIIVFNCISDHYIYANNLALIWCNPFWILFLIPRLKSNKVIFILSIALIIGGFLSLIILKQSFSLYLLLFILATRPIFYRIANKRKIESS